ncbi:MAG: hypothetical protein O7G85_01165 [Planctomycetota bacterium]|nr:hypothetical protein [Planctomycetota bacterium]
MRWAIDSLVALMIAGVIAGIVLHVRQDEQLQIDTEVVRGDVQRFRQQITLQSALGVVEMSDQGYPAVIDPEWFKSDQGNLPQNPLLDDQHPWLEIAGPNQSDLVHPVNRAVSDRRTAKFWYNPYTGAVRARVPGGISDVETILQYNYVNNCTLESLFVSGSVFDNPNDH